MKTDRLLYLCAYRMTAYRWHSGVLESEGVFAANDEGHQQFADYVKQHRQATFTLLANVSEEGFHLETIPFLQGKDRKTVIEGAAEIIERSEVIRFTDTGASPWRFRPPRASCACTGPCC